MPKKETKVKEHLRQGRRVQEHNRVAVEWYESVGDPNCPWAEDKQEYPELRGQTMACLTTMDADGNLTYDEEEDGSYYIALVGNHTPETLLRSACDYFTARRAESLVTSGVDDYDDIAGLFVAYLPAEEERLHSYFGTTRPKNILAADVRWNGPTMEIARFVEVEK